jgi:hypothetical protein
MTTWIDEFRIVKNQAVWTSGFTPPTVAYATGDIPAFTGLVTDRTAVLATTEAADTASFTGTVASAAVTGTLIVTEAADVAAFNGVANPFGTLVVTEAPDTAAFPAGKVEWRATLVVTEAGDTASFPGGTVQWSVTLITAEAADVAAFNGNVSWNATLVATEAADTAAFNGQVFSAVTGTLITTEAADTPAFTGTVVTAGTITGTFLVTEAADTPAFTGAVTGVAGALAVTEGADTAAFNGQVLNVVTGTLITTEAADTAAFTGNLSLLGISGTLTATEAADTASFTGTKATTVSAKLVTSFTPSSNRNDFTILVGMQFALTVNTPFNGIGLRCGLNNTGLHTVGLYDFATNTLLRSANVDLTGKTEGTFYYADITPITLVAGTTYALMALVTAGNGQMWSEYGPTTLKDAQPGSIGACYSLPPGAAITSTSLADSQYHGVDLSYSVTVPDAAPIRGGGDAWVDYGREKRRKPRGLRQAQKFFEERQLERDAEKRRLEEVAARARERAEQEAARAFQDGEFARAQAILDAARQQQQRQAQIDNMMMALSNDRLEQARLELALLQARMNERDEEDAISVLLLH